MDDVANYQGVEDKPGQYWRYTFLVVIDGVPMSKVFYAFSEKDARKDLLQELNIEEAKLLERKPW